MVTPGRCGRHATGQFREILHWHRNNNGMTWVGLTFRPQRLLLGKDRHHEDSGLDARVHSRGFATRPPAPW
jgi:hypothetical protein